MRLKSCEEAQNLSGRCPRRLSEGGSGEVTAVAGKSTGVRPGFQIRCIPPYYSLTQTSASDILRSNLTGHTVTAAMTERWQNVTPISHERSFGTRRWCQIPSTHWLSHSVCIDGRCRHESAVWVAGVWGDVNLRRCCDMCRIACHGVSRLCAPMIDTMC